MKGCCAKKCKLENRLHCQIISHWKLDANNCIMYIHKYIIPFSDLLGIDCCQNYRNGLKFRKVRTNFWS